MAKYFSDQKMRSASGRKVPRSWELKSKSADKIIRYMGDQIERKPSNNKKARYFAGLSDKDKIKFLRKKLYRLYDQKLDAEEFGLETHLIDSKINNIENQIQVIQFEMFD